MRMHGIILLTICLLKVDERACLFNGNLLLICIHDEMREMRQQHVYWMSVVKITAYKKTSLK